MVQSRLVQWTSHEAYAELLEGGVLGEQEREYLSLLCSHKEGLTDGEAAVILGWPRSTVSARRNGVMKATQADGRHVIVNPQGLRRKNPGSKSKTALVWMVVKKNE